MRSAPTAVVALALLAGTACAQDEKAPALTGVVTRVVDGQMLYVRPDGQRRSVLVRLIGVDAPLKATREKDGQEPWGTRAQQHLSLLTTRKEVKVEFDVLVPVKGSTARWGYVWLGEKLLNEEALRAGHAALDTQPPNVKYVDRLRKVQVEARDKGRGIWDPKEPLPAAPGGVVDGAKGKPAVGTLAQFEPGCVIANKVSKKYHVDGGRFYESMKTSKNAVYFKTVEDAKGAGYTASAR